MDITLTTILCLAACVTASQRICLQLEDDSTGDRNGSGSIQGRPGKIGPKGEMGPPGAVGPEGVVNYAIINATINERMKEVEQLLRTEYEMKLNETKESMNRRVSELEALFEGLDRIPTEKVAMKLEALFEGLDRIPTEKVAMNSCDITYEEVCYWFQISRETNISFLEAKSICEENGLELGFPVDEAHYGLILSYIREQMPLDAANEYRVWTGLEITPGTSIVTLSNGNPAPYVKWLPKEPTGGSSDTKIYFFVRKDTSRSSGMADFTPNYDFNGIICQN